jgi:TrpR-related protein YerC/YecD
MTKISFKKLSEKKTQELTDQLWKAVTLLENKSEVRSFLHDILTHTEIQMLAKRLEVVRLLDEGYKYEEIRKSLNISEATISKIQNWREAFGQGYNIVLERLKKFDNKKMTNRKRIFNRGQAKAARDVWGGVAKATISVYKKYKKRSSVKN